MKNYELDANQKKLYTSEKSTPFYVEVPDMSYLVFSGKGHPAEEDFQLACEALFTLSYILKFDIARKELLTDYKVNPMEVSWYLDKQSSVILFTWDMMLMQPPFITKEHVKKAIEIAKDKGKQIAADRVKFEKRSFNRCVQCFHRGDYNNMNATLQKMKDFAASDGYEYDLYTHDIYLNDMRKTKVENYKTIMRIGVR